MNPLVDKLIDTGVLHPITEVLPCDGNRDAAEYPIAAQPFHRLYRPFESALSPSRIRYLLAAFNTDYDAEIGHFLQFFIMGFCEQGPIGENEKEILFVLIAKVQQPLEHEGLPTGYEKSVYTEIHALGYYVIPFFSVEHSFFGVRRGLIDHIPQCRGKTTFTPQITLVCNTQNHDRRDHETIGKVHCPCFL